MGCCKELGSVGPTLLRLVCHPPPHQVIYQLAEFGYSVVHNWSMKSVGVKEFWIPQSHLLGLVIDRAWFNVCTNTT